MKLPLLFALSVLSGVGSAIQCTKGVVVFCVRGTDPMHHSLKFNPQYNELPTGMNRTAHALVKKAGEGRVAPIKYPALDLVHKKGHAAAVKYAKSVAIGIHELQKEIKRYDKHCKEGKIIVIGYSQGAEVVSGALGGAYGYFKPVKAPITAALNWADPGFVNHLQPIDAGNATLNHADGTVPNNTRQQDYINKRYAGRYRSYCQSGDKYCNSGHGVSGNESENIHVVETETYEKEATDFLLEFV